MYKHSLIISIKRLWGDIFMRYLIFTKRQLTLAISCVLVFTLTVVGTISAFAMSNRKLPIYCVENNKKQISISFDAAWGADDTDQLISILKKYKVKATFFVVGAWVDKYPDEVKKLSEAGHRVENHCNSHPYMTKLSTEKMITELTACNDKIKEITGRKPVLFRAPYGDYNNAVIEAVESVNMYTIQWNIDSLDWFQSATPESIIDNVTKKATDGSIILMHNDAEHTPAALPTILKTLQDDGYEFVLIEDLILKENYTIDHTGKQCKN